MGHGRVYTTKLEISLQFRSLLRLAIYLAGLLAVECQTVRMLGQASQAHHHAP